jgi:hypothetical protein
VSQVAALASAIGSAALGSWSEMVFSGTLGPIGAEDVGTLLKDLSKLRVFLHGADRHIVLAVLL